MKDLIFPIVVIGIAAIICCVLTVDRWVYGRTHGKHPKAAKALSDLIEQSKVKDGNCNYWITVGGVGSKESYGFYYFTGSEKQPLSNVSEVYAHKRDSKRTGKVSVVPGTTNLTVVITGEGIGEPVSIAIDDAP